VAATPLALDACILINLAATGQLEHIADVLGLVFLVVREVSDEALYLRSDDPTHPRPIPIDLSAPVAAGAIEVTDLCDGELTTFVAAAHRLDHGEAATVSLAVNRGLQLATDDRAARGLLAADHPDVTVTTTPQLLRRYCESAEIPTDHAVRCLTTIEQRASFTPGATDPDFVWWQSIRNPSPLAKP
jgi:predicted nucleic acid-binding protein